VEDESYIIGLLRKKNNELTAEVKRLREELTQHERDHGNYQSYEKRAECEWGPTHPGALWCMCGDHRPDPLGHL